MRSAYLAVIIILSLYLINCSRVSPGGTGGTGLPTTPIDGASGTDGAGGAGGATGTDGVDGTNGEAGASGRAGMDCWDVNGNGTGDVDTEDNTGDGLVNFLDCQAYICRTATQTNCISCELDENGRCLVVDGPPSCSMETDQTCREANPCKETVIQPTCAGCDPIRIPPSSTECLEEGTRLPDASYKSIKIELVACMSGFHVLKPTLGTLSWQTLSGYAYGILSDGYGAGREGTNNHDEFEPQYTYDIALAPHCYQTLDRSHGAGYYWLKNRYDSDLYNKALYKITKEDGSVSDFYSTWESPAYNYLDFSDIVAGLNVDYKYPYFIDDLEIKGRDQHGSSYDDFIFRHEKLDTIPSIGQKKYYIDTTLWDSGDDINFGPIMEINFNIRYSELPSNNTPEEQ